MAFLDCYVAPTNINTVSKNRCRLKKNERSVRISDDNKNFARWICLFVVAVLALLRLPDGTSEQFCHCKNLSGHKILNDRPDIGLKRACRIQSIFNHKFAFQAMPSIIEVVPNHPLTPIHCHRERLTLGNGIRMASIRQGFGYIKLMHHGKPEAAAELLSDRAMTWNPDRIPMFLKKQIPEENVNFLANTEEILRAIMSEQLKTVGNPFCEALEEELQHVPNPRDVQFRVYTTHNDLILTSGYPYGKWNEHDEMPGFDVYGKLLAEMARVIMGEEPKENVDVKELLSNMALFKPHVPRSLLLVSDSQHRYMKSIDAGGDVVPVSGGKYQEMVDVLQSSRFKLFEYKWIGIYCGINCGVRHNYTFDQRNAEWAKLKALLVEEASRRDKPSVFFCCSFDHATKNRGNSGHAAFIERELQGTGVVCINWQRLGNPFLLRNGLLNFSLFDVQGKDPRHWNQEIHINHRGNRVLWKAYCQVMEGLKFIRYTDRKVAQSVLKSAFVPLPSLLAAEPNAQMEEAGPSTSQQTSKPSPTMRCNLKITVPAVQSEIAPPVLRDDGRIAAKDTAMPHKASSRPDDRQRPCSSGTNSGRSHDDRRRHKSPEDIRRIERKKGRYEDKDCRSYKR